MVKIGINLPLFYYSLKRTQWLGQEEIVSLQEGRLKRLVNHAYNHVPYYRNLFDKLKLKPFDINLSLIHI